MDGKLQDLELPDRNIVCKSLSFLQRLSNLNLQGPMELQAPANWDANLRTSFQKGSSIGGNACGACV
jgi:hypothetical protein